MELHPARFAFSDLALTRDPVTSRIDFDWDVFNRAIGESGLQPIYVDNERNLEFYVPMLIMLYRYARAAGQPLDLAAEAVNRDFDPYGTKEEVLRASVRRQMCFDIETAHGLNIIRIIIPQDLRFADLQLRAGSHDTPHFNGATLHKILVHSRITTGELQHDAIDVQALADEWYQLARLAGEPDDPFMESVRETVKFTLTICGSLPTPGSHQPREGLFFSAPIGNQGERLPVRVPVDVQLRHLELDIAERCAWAPLFRILSVSGLDADALGESYPACPVGTVPVNVPIAALIRAWVTEAMRVGVPVDNAIKAHPCIAA